MNRSGGRGRGRGGANKAAQQNQPPPQMPQQNNPMMAQVRMTGHMQMHQSPHMPHNSNYDHNVSNGSINPSQMHPGQPPMHMQSKQQSPYPFPPNMQPQMRPMIHSHSQMPPQQQMHPNLMNQGPPNHQMIPHHQQQQQPSPCPPMMRMQNPMPMQPMTQRSPGPMKPNIHSNMPSNVACSNNNNNSANNNHAFTNGGPPVSSSPQSSNQQQPHCSGCNKPIYERYLLKALDQLWHEDCLKCQCCQARLGEVGHTLYFKANLILCKRDYFRMFGQPGVCSACSQKIPPFELVMKAKSNSYHMECFACHRCNHRFCVGDKFFLIENRVLCENDCENRPAAPPQNISLPRNTNRPPSAPTSNPQMHNTFANATPPSGQMVGSNATLTPYMPTSQSPKIQASNVSMVHNNSLPPTSNSSTCPMPQQPLSAPATPIMVPKQNQSPQLQVPSHSNSGSISNSSAQSISSSGSNNNIKSEPSDVQSESIPPCLM